MCCAFCDRFAKYAWYVAQLFGSRSFDQLLLHIFKVDVRFPKIFPDGSDIDSMFEHKYCPFSLYRLGGIFMRVARYAIFQFPVLLFGTGFYRLAQALMETGEIAQAASAIESGLSIDPGQF